MITHRRVVFAIVAMLTAVSACSLSPQTIEVSGRPEIVVPPTTGIPVPPAVLSLDDLMADTTTLDPAGSAELSIGAAPAIQNGDGRAPISVGFAGDTSFHNGLHLYEPLASASPFLQLPDFMVLNLETAVAAPQIGSPPVQKQFLFRSDPAIVDQLVEAGIDAVTMANNHALDFGPDALAEGLRLLDDAGIQTVGASADPDTAYEPIIQTIGDWSIGIASFSRVPCDWAWIGKNVRPGVAWACPPFLDQADAVVSELVEQVDLAIVMVHGGTEGQLCPDETMKGLNERWADLGAGLVVNSHPHVVQGVSSIGETVVVNSTGNFAFPPSVGLTANSAVFIATLSEQGLFLSVEPFVAEAGLVRAGSPLRRASILNQIEQYSTGWRVLADGRVIQDNSWAGACQISG